MCVLSICSSLSVFSVVCQYLSAHVHWTVALRALKGALHVSMVEVLWSVLSVIQCCLWWFPFLLSKSRRWDHRTSLHRWQLGLKVSRSRGSYRLLARCEIQPCMLFLPAPDPFITHRDEMGCQGLSPEAEKKKPAIFVFLLSSLFQGFAIRNVVFYTSFMSFTSICFVHSEAWIFCAASLHPHSPS